MVRRLLFLLLASSSLCLACGPRAPADDAGDAPRDGAVLDFNFAGIDGTPVTSESTRGRVTVLLFMTTFDVASQAQTRRLEDLYRTHAPRLNAVGVVLEAPQYVELARSFRDSVGLSFPLAIVDRTTLATHPQLKSVQSVPAWVFLDARGVVVASAAGALTPDQLEATAKSAE